MQHKSILCGLTLLLTLAAPLQAQDEHSAQEQLNFARKLREKGYVDLSLEYFEKMAQNPGAIEHTLRFELAKTRLMLARNLDPEERLGVIEQSRTELEEFLRKYGNSAEAAVVRQDLKRLTGEQAQAILSLALRLRGIPAQQEKAKQAEQFFLKNAAEIEASIKTGSAEERLRARFDLAVNKMEQARCYVNLADEPTRYKRVDIVAQARKLFDELARSDQGKIGLLSKAWLIKCCSEDEGSDPLVSNKYYEELKNLTAKDAEEARRLARYFQMVRYPKIQNITLSSLERYKKVQAEAEAWLKAYPGQSRSPVGYGVRYELAHALFQEALLLKEGPRQASLYARAQDILYALNESDNDLIGKVTELRSRIARVHLSGKANISIGELATFDLCQIRAAIEFDRAQNLAAQVKEAKEEALKKKGAALQIADRKTADLDKKLTERLRAAVHAWSRALALADRRTPRYAIENVRFDLLVAYAQLESSYRTRTPYRTAIFGESLGKTNPPSKHSALALELAIDAYTRIIGVDPSDGNRQRLHALAEFVLSPERARLWDKDDVVSLAHYHLALLDQQEAQLLFAQAERTKDSSLLKTARTKLQDAVEHLNKLPRVTAADKSRFFFAQGKAVFLALEARTKVGFPAEKEYYRDLARKLIADLPPLPDGIDSTSANQYFHAKMEESKFLYEDAARLFNQKKSDEALQKYKEMAEFLDRIERQLAAPAIKLEEDRLKQLRYYVGTMEKYAAFGRADLEYRAGHYDRVLLPEMTGKVVEFVKKEAEKDAVVRLKDFQITGQIVGLALRANVQQGKIDEATRLMKILKNIRDEKRKRAKPSDNPEDDENSLVDPSELLRGLFAELDVQILEFRRKGDQPDRLAQTQKNFTQFLDALVQHAGKKLDRKDLFFLARCYDTLDQHDKAARLYGEYPRPPAIDAVKKDKEKFSEEEERELQAYCYSQVMLARQLRLGKKTTEAKEKLDAVLAHRNPRQLLQIEREQICLLEDAGLFGTAITRWSTLMNSPTFKATDPSNERERKKIYFDAYYHLSYCWYKYSQTEKVKAAGKDGQFLIKAVDYIIRLENAQSEGWQLVGHRFRDLLQSDRVLMDAYTKQGGKGP